MRLSQGHLISAELLIPLEPILVVKDTGASTSIQIPDSTPDRVAFSESTSNLTGPYLDRPDLWVSDSNVTREIWNTKRSQDLAIVPEFEAEAGWMSDLGVWYAERCQVRRRGQWCEVSGGSGRV